MRSSAQRVGDVVLVLCLVAILSFVSQCWLAFEAASSDWGTFAAFLGIGSAQALFPGFAAAASFNWMDDERESIAKWGIVAVLAVSGLAVIAHAIWGLSGDQGVQRGPTYLYDASLLTMALGGIAIVQGIVPTQFGGLGGQVDDE